MLILFFPFLFVVEIQPDSPPVTIQEGFGSIITMLRYQFCLSAEGTGKLHENQKNRHEFALRENVQKA